MQQKGQPVDNKRKPAYTIYRKGYCDKRLALFCLGLKEIHANRHRPGWRFLIFNEKIYNKSRDSAEELIAALSRLFALGQCLLLRKSAVPNALIKLKCLHQKKNRP